MSEEMQIDGKSYISSKRASQLSGYAQDYIGQLSRKSLIDARRIGGLWYVSMESLLAYQKKAEEFKPEPPSRANITPEPDTLVFFDGKQYISAARAAEITGYAQDYVGQLARSGTILSQQVGNRWYVEKQSLSRHKSEKDRLLGAVQSESVGLSRPRTNASNTVEYAGYASAGPLLTYFSEEKDLLPVPDSRQKTQIEAKVSEIPINNVGPYVIPIRKVREYKVLPTPTAANRAASIALPIEHGTRSTFPLLLGAAATIIIVLSIGYASVLKQNSAYAINMPKMTNTAGLPAAVAASVERIGDILEPYLTHELIYESSEQN
jgi:hypothetical protein